jgi:hypothetical protein
MAKDAPKPTLLSWSAFVPVSEGEDPLGLNRRVSTRLAGQLFYCITSITPRARYYSFLPWAVSLATQSGLSKPLRDRVRAIEKAFTTGCLLHHDGHACQGGRLVGSEILLAWYTQPRRNRINLDTLPFAKNPALDAYVASLANLGLFQTSGEVAEPESDEEVQPTSLQDAGLSELGRKVAASYGKAVKSTGAESIIGDEYQKAEDSKLSEWGKRGGLCELRAGGPDREILLDLFFNRAGLEAKAHHWRRDSLLLILHLANRFADMGIPLKQETFGEAVYFCQAHDDQQKVKPALWQKALEDIGRRWRMFYFHYYLRGALENLFVAVVSQGNQKRLEGFRLEELLEPLAKERFNRNLRELMGVKYEGAFADLTPADLFAAAGTKITGFGPGESRLLEQLVPMDHPLSESSIHALLDQQERYGTPEAIALAAILCIVACLRYRQWEDGPYGHWLAQSVKDDPYQNVTMPVVVRELTERFDDVWNTPFRDLLVHILQRFVIRLHLSLAYQKSGSFFFVDEERIRGRGKRYDSPSYGNGRFASAILILRDLNLLEEVPDADGLLHRTADGDSLLKNELRGGAEA